MKPELGKMKYWGGESYCCYAYWKKKRFCKAVYDSLNQYYFPVEHQTK